MSVPSYSPTTVSTEGRHARERGDPVDANPYPEGSDPHRIWKRGYESVDGEAAETLGPDALDDDT
ncbi:MAG: hypothetical protein INR70_07900 [Parafilimonas terrae]|nr:hypothetical protein [Parafilimonas terrae]